MTRPMIRHLAIFARDPEKVARFYREALEMDLVSSDEESNAHFLSDGHLTLAILPHRLEGSAPAGLNHFGFSGVNLPKAFDSIAAFGLEEPKRRGAHVPYAEFRAVDPEGNWFDLTALGYEDDDAAPRVPAATAG